MDRIKVSIGIKDSVFSEKLKGLSRYVEIVGESASLEAIKENLERVDLLFLDSIPPMGFSNLKTKGVIVASRYGRRKEFLAARSGAKGFITKDISGPNLLMAIKGISTGEVWMTRVTIARVFEAYARLEKGEANVTALT